MPEERLQRAARLSGLRKGVLRSLEQVVAGQPPRHATELLIVLLGGLAAAAHLPGLLPLTVAAGTLGTVLVAVWTRGLATGAWVGAGVLVLLPLPAAPRAGLVMLGAAGFALVAAALIRSLMDQLSAAQQAALQQYGARDEVVRSSRAQHDELVGQVEYWASHDRLTRVLNRTLLVRHLEQLAAAGKPAGVVVVSAAGFTAVNDRFGPTFADELLVALAGRLRARARDSDVVARLGGDEFAVVLPGLTGEHAAAVCGRLLQVLDDPFTLGSQLFTLHARCGLALDDGSFTAGGAELMRQASSAARSARVDAPPAVFNASTQAELQSVLGIEADLHSALERDELFLLYQPLVATQTGRIESVEALVRWQHPERGLVPPDEFIGVAERTGQIVGIGIRVLELAVAQLREWSAGPAPSLTVAVNVSARQLVEPGFVDQVQSILWASGVDPSLVLLELTESLLVEDSDAAIAALWQLRGLGVRLALDDFGTGYSSLARLGELPLDELKIDKSFVDRLGVGPHDSTALVTAAIAMGQGLGLTVVAEGVETELQAAQLSQLGCDLLQGYWLGRPQTAASLADKLGTRLLVDCASIPTPRPSQPTEEMIVPGLLPDVARPPRSSSNDRAL